MMVLHVFFITFSLLADRHIGQVRAEKTKDFLKNEK